MLYVEDIEFELVRSAAEIAAAINELDARIWYVRFWAQAQHLYKEDGEWHEVYEDAKSTAREIEQRYAKETLGPYRDFEWGALKDEFAVLFWLQGSDWGYGVPHPLGKPET